jgi:DNA-directed RNA polymerase subunit RPC12/RpoP
MPKIKCSTCGKENVLPCAEYSKTMGFLDNRMKKRPVDPIYVCSSCGQPTPLGWATLSNGKVLFNCIKEEGATT